MDVTAPGVDRRTRPVLSVRRGSLALVFVALMCGSIVMGLRESAPATTAPGTLLSVDHRDGGNSGTGLVTVQYVDGAGHQATAQVVMTVSGWPSLDPGTPITVYLRNGRAVDQHDPLLATIPLAVLQAVILWLLVVFAFREFGSRRPDVSRRPSRSSRLEDEGEDQNEG